MATAATTPTPIAALVLVLVPELPSVGAIVEDGAVTEGKFDV